MSHLIATINTERTADVLRAIRAARFRQGLRCPRCAAQHVHRWGQFAGRQRYRCRACTRTFSDLTGTPAAYSKRLDRWPAYCGIMLGSYSLRRTAGVLGINLSTAFRWRHAILRELTRNDRTMLTGLVEFDELYVAHSMKGSRRLDRPPRARGATRTDPLLFHTDRVTVIFARDRSESSFARHTDARHVSSFDLRSVVQSRLRTPVTVLSRHGRYSRYAMLAAAAGAKFCRVPTFGASSSLHHVENVRRTIRQFCEWMQRFRGVATRYLDHYLRWHALIDAGRRFAGRAAGRRVGLPPRASI